MNAQTHYMHVRVIFFDLGKKGEYIIIQNEHFSKFGGKGCN